MSAPPAGRVLVVGSYPPVPVPATAVTLAAVERAWAEGREVAIVSPRPSAAHLAVPIVGLRAGRRLARARRLTGTDRLVLCLEPDVPVAAGPLWPGPAQWRRLSTALLTRAVRRFDHVTVVVPAGMDPRARWLAPLLGAADVVARDERPPAATAWPTADPEPAGWPARWPAGARRAARRALRRQPAGVTTLGPAEPRLTNRARRLVSRVLVLVLGRRAAPVRARVAALRARARVLGRQAAGRLRPPGRGRRPS